MGGRRINPGRTGTAASAIAGVRNNPFMIRETGPLRKLVTLVSGVILLLLGLMALCRIKTVEAPLFLYIQERP